MRFRRNLRVDGSEEWETPTRGRLFRRLRLRRADGRVYLDRWAVGHDRVGMVMLHRMTAPDPGLDLHDHPWRFRSLILWGGYVEERCSTRLATRYAVAAAVIDGNAPPGADPVPRGPQYPRRPGAFTPLGLDECHRIVELLRPTCWTLVIRGPRRREWGFYLPAGWVDEATYDATVRADRRDLWSEQAADARPW